MAENFNLCKNAKYVIFLFSSNQNIIRAILIQNNCILHLNAGILSPIFLDFMKV